MTFLKGRSPKMYFYHIKSNILRFKQPRNGGLDVYVYSKNELSFFTTLIIFIRDNINILSLNLQINSLFKLQFKSITF